MAVALVLLLIIGTVIIFAVQPKRAQQEAQNSFNTVDLPLDNLIASGSSNLLGTRSLRVNGNFLASGGFIISPSTQPSNAAPGQIYYDNATNQLAYYNGSGFVNLTNAPAAGTGLSFTNNQFTNTGVLSVQGQTGAVSLTAGNGIIIDGTTISRTNGVNSLVSGSVTLDITDDGSGNLTISNNGAGSGTVQSPGGTTNRIAKFTGVQTIADSLLSDNGTVVTVSGDLSVTGSLTLGTALSVSNGGTGATTLTNNGVLVGQGAGAITAITAGGTGLCFMSTAGTPAFSACPGGVTSVNGQTGVLTIANASGAASTITINNASTGQKGIAQFNATNFSDNGAGTINTIQNINSGATPTFAGVNTNSINPSGALSVGSTSQAFTLQGTSGSVINATNGVNSTTLAFEAPTAAITYQFRNAAAGTWDVCTTVGNCAGVGGGVTTAGGSTGTIPVFTGSQAIGNSLISQSGSVITVNGDLSLSAGHTYQINGVQISSADLSNDSNLAKLNATQTFTGGTNTFRNSGNSALAFNIQNAASQNIFSVNTSAGTAILGQGSALSGQLVFSNSTNNNTITLVGTPASTPRTITLPDDTGIVCLSTGNCAGAGVTLQAAYNNSTSPEITVDATRGALTIRDNSTPIGANLLEVQNNAGSTTYFGVNSAGVSVTGTVTFSGLGATDNQAYLCRNTSNQLAACSTSGTGAAFVQGGNSFGATATIGTNDPQDVAIERNNVTQLTIGNGTITLASGGDLLLQGANAYISNPQNAVNSEVFGLNAAVGGDRVAVFGNSASASGNDAVAIGYSATAATGGVGIGRSASCSNTACTSVGASSQAGFMSVALGGDANASQNNSIAIGEGATTTTTNQLVIGANGNAITQAIIGNGVTNAVPVGFTLQGTSGVGVDIGGASVVIAGGQSTGAASGGNVNFQISAPGSTGSGANSLSTVASLSGTTGSALFQNAVNSATAFRVQNVAGQNILSVNSTAGTLVLGQASALAGNLVFSNATNANTITLTTAVASTPRTITFPDATGTVCLTTGNCAGSGGGIIGSGSTDKIAKFTASGTIGDSSITDNGTTVTDSVNLVVQGGSVTIGTTGQAASLLLHDGNSQKTTLQAGDSAGDLIFILPTTTGSTNQCLKQSGTGNQLVWQDCDGGSGGSSATLQTAYNNGRTINATSGTGDIAFTLTSANFTNTIADNSSSFVSITRANGPGTADPAQLLLVDNLDTDRAAPIGIKLQAAAGGMTTAIDATDAEIGDALNVAANNIKGTTGDIDFTNFDVTGANGNVVTGGDVAVNGGDITSSGALRITPTSSLTAGATGQTTTIQGSATTLTSNGAGNDITLTSADTIELQGATNITGALAVSGTVTATTLGATNTATYLCRNGSNQIAACSTTGTGAAFLQGGNLFGATATLGTNDGNALVLRTNSTTRMTLASGGGILIAKNDTADELEIGDDVFNLNDSAARLSIANTTDNSFIRVGQSTTSYGYVGWAYNSLSAAAFMRLGTANDANFLSLQADSTDGVTINGTTEPGTGIGLQLEGSNLASISSSNFIVSSQNTLTLDVDSSANDTSSTFKVTRDDGAATLFTVDQNGTAILPGGQTADITSTTTSGTASAMTIQPANSTAGLGAVLNLRGGQTNASGNTAGAVAISGGNEVGTGSTTGGAVSINGGTGNTAGAVNIGNTAAGSINLGNTSSNIQTTINGLALVKSGSSNSASAFQVQSSTGAEVLFSVDTTARSGSGGNLVKIGNSTGTDTNLTVLQLDATTADPTSNLSALNGGLFYDSTTNKVKLIENGQIKIICNTTDLGCGTGTVTLQTAYTNSTSPEITVDGTRGAVSIQDAASPIGANLFEVQSNGGGTKYFAAAAGGISTIGTATQTYSSTSDASTITLTSTSGTQTNGMLLNRNGSGGTTTNGINITQTAGTLTNGLAFTGTIGTDITRGSGTLTLQGNGGITLKSATGNIAIGTSDTTGTLLVLDTKTDAGDPTGVDGAMYYNSNMAMMRCYYDGSWRFCNEPMSMSWGYNFQEDFINYDTTNPQTFIGSNNWIGNNTSGLPAAVYHVNATDPKHPGVVRVDDGTDGVNTAYATLMIGSNGFGSEPILIGGGEVIETSVNLGSLSDATDEYIARLGLCDTDNSDCADGVYFEYDRTTSTNWSIVTASGSTRTRTQSTTAGCSAGGTPVSVSPGSWIRFKIVINSAATQANFYINGAFVGCITSNIPTAAGHQTSPYFTVQKESSGTTARYMDIDYFNIRNNFSTQR